MARAIRSNTPDAVIIFITGHATASSADELIGIADEYLSKPFDLDTLRETVSTLVARRKGHGRPNRHRRPARRGKKWVHLYCDDPAANALLLAACEQAQRAAHHRRRVARRAARRAGDGREPRELRGAQDHLGLSGEAPQLPGGAADGSRAASDSAAAVALKASWRISLPAKPEQAFVVLSGALK